MIYQRISRRVQGWAPSLRRMPGGRALGRGARFLLDAGYREEVRLRLFRERDMFQAAGRTWPDRYPQVFACLADRLAGQAEPRILSFGCSTGEEVAMLRAAAPSARITGIDISPRRIRTARRRFDDPRIAFADAARVEELGAAPFDAIVCMAVLQRSELNHDRPGDCSPWLTFDKFERAILDIDRHLRPGGLLALYHTNFRLADTRVGAVYSPVLSSLPKGVASAKYGADNRLRPDQPDDREMLFIKRADEP